MSDKKPANVVIEIIPTKFRDDAVEKQVNAHTGKLAAPTYEAYVAQIRNGKSVLANLTDKRYETLEAIGVPVAILAECRKAMDEAHALTVKANPARSFEVIPKAAAKAVSTFSLSSLTAPKAAGTARR